MHRHPLDQLELGVTLKHLLYPQARELNSNLEIVTRFLDLENPASTELFMVNS